MKFSFCSVLMLSTILGNLAHAATSFEIDEFRVEGNTTLDEGTINEALYPFVGPNKTAADVENARAALGALYAAHGYSTVFAQVPRQKVVDGVIEIDVLERTVRTLKVTGAKHFSAKKVAATAPSMAPGVVPNMNHVKHDLLALNQWPDRTVTPVLKAGATPGTVDVELQVKETSPVHASIEINDRQSLNTTDLRTVAQASYTNLWQRGDTISLMVQVAPLMVKDSAVFSASYMYRLPDSDRTLTLSFLDSNSDVATVGTSSVIGKGYDAGLSYAIPLRARADFVDSINFGADYKHVSQVIPGQTTNYNVYLNYVPVNANYSAIWIDQDITTSVSPSVRANFSGLSSNNKTLIDRSNGTSLPRWGAAGSNVSPNFFLIRLDASHTRPLLWGTQIYIHVAGQESMEPLQSGEQLSLGGADTVRGYLESESLGDWGAYDQIEWRSPKITAPKWSVDEVRLFGFVDTGEVWSRQALAGERATTGLASAGIGLRATLAKDLTAEFEGGQVLVSGPNTRAGSRKFLFRLVGGF